MTTTTLEVDSPVGLLRLRPYLRSPNDVGTFGGSPIGVEVKPGQRTFTVYGHPYGGHLQLALSGQRLAGFVYRAGVEGPTHADAEVIDAALNAAADHCVELDVMVDALLRERLQEHADAWAAELARLRIAAAHAERQVERCQALQDRQHDGSNERNQEQCEQPASDECERTGRAGEAEHAGD